jgi:uncharacterized protein YukE
VCEDRNLTSDETYAIENYGDHMDDARREMNRLRAALRNVAGVLDNIAAAIRSAEDAPEKCRKIEEIINSIL